MGRRAAAGELAARGRGMHAWLRALAVWAVAGAGAVAVYLLLDATVDAGLIGLLIGFVVFSFAGDLVLAWRNERATELGHTVEYNDMRGRRGVAVENFRPAAGGCEGRIRLGGERWQARAAAARVDAGAAVVVVGRERLTLLVEPAGAGAGRS